MSVQTTVCSIVVLLINLFVVCPIMWILNKVFPTVFGWWWKIEYLQILSTPVVLCFLGYCFLKTSTTLEMLRFYRKSYRVCSSLWCEVKNPHIQKMLKNLMGYSLTNMFRKSEKLSICPWCEVSCSNVCIECEESIWD